MSKSSSSYTSERVVLEISQSLVVVMILKSRIRNMSKSSSSNASDRVVLEICQSRSSNDSERVKLEICQSLVVVMQVTESY